MNATMHRPSRVLLLYAIGYLAFLYVPVLLLPLFSFNDSIYISFPLQGFTLKWYEQMLSTPQLHATLWNSIRVALVTAFVSTILGTLSARAVTRYRMFGRRGIIGVIMLPLVIPEIILGTSLLILVNQIGLGLNLISVTIAHVLLTLPFAMAVLISRFEGFDSNLEDASRDLGENAWMTFWRVTFPLVFPGILASLLLSFTISFDEFIMAFFLTGTDTTLPVYIYSQLRFPERLPPTLALGAAILVVSFLVVAFAEWLRRRGDAIQVGKGQGNRGL